MIIGEKLRRARPVKPGVVDGFSPKQVGIGASIRLSAKLVLAMAEPGAPKTAFQIIKSDAIRILGEELHDAAHELKGETCKVLTPIKCELLQRMIDGLRNA